MSIRNLELRARVIVEGFWNGLHRSPNHGFSVEFTEYRQYSPDDDPRYLDWRVFARSDRYFIKKFEDETNLRCYLVTDRSRSMSYGSLPYNKWDYTATLAATLAFFLHSQADAVGLVTFDSEIREYIPARYRAGHLRQLLHALEKPVAGGATELGSPLRRLPELVRKRGLVIVLSDFLAPLEQLGQQLGALSACGHELIVFQVLDPAEITFNFQTPSQFEDIESGRRLFIEPASVRQEYLRRFEAHCQQLRAVCDRLGAACYRLETGFPLASVLQDVLRERMRRGRKVRRNRVSGRGGGL